MCSLHASLGKHSPSFSQQFWPSWIESNADATQEMLGQSSFENLSCNGSIASPLVTARALPERFDPRRFSSFGGETSAEQAPVVSLTLWSPASSPRTPPPLLRGFVTPPRFAVQSEKSPRSPVLFRGQFQGVSASSTALSRSDLSPTPTRVAHSTPVASARSPRVQVQPEREYAQMSPRLCSAFALFPMPANSPRTCEVSSVRMSAPSFVRVSSPLAESRIGKCQPCSSNRSLHPVPAANLSPRPGSVHVLAGVLPGNQMHEGRTSDYCGMFDPALIASADATSTQRELTPRPSPFAMGTQSATASCSSLDNTTPTTTLSTSTPAKLVSKGPVSSPLTATRVESSRDCRAGTSTVYVRARAKHKTQFRQLETATRHVAPPVTPVQVTPVHAPARPKGKMRTVLEKLQLQDRSSRYSPGFGGGRKSDNAEYTL